MNADFDYLEINRKSWNDRVDVHFIYVVWGKR